MFNSEKINLKNAIINPIAVNEILRERDSPMRLKCGMIGRISLKVSSIKLFINLFLFVLQTSIINLFTESCSFELNDIQLIFGPNLDHFSKESDFNKDPQGAFYSIDKPLENIEMMNDLVEKIR
jgi:hypothetical protein